MLKSVKTQSSFETDGQLVTKAVLNAADALGVNQGVLAKVIGVSDSTVSRWVKDGTGLSPTSKAFELCLVFVRLFRSLESIVQDADTSKQWMRNDNTALNGKPIDLITEVTGLIHVVNYLDARRTPV
mgnify:CR=1 FL=1